MRDLAFTLYDLVAYFVPGAIVVWALTELAGRMGLCVQSITTLPETALVVVALAAIYAMGHALHAIANLTIDFLPFGGYPPRNYFPKQFENDFQEPFRTTLYGHIVRSFHVQGTRQPGDSIAVVSGSVNDTVKNAYWACYTVVAQSKPNSLVQVFSSMSGLCRGLCVGCFVIALAYLVGSFLLNSLTLLIVVAVALGAGCLFLNRAMRFKRYLTRTVYSDFLYTNKELLSDKK